MARKAADPEQNRKVPGLLHAEAAGNQERAVDTGSPDASTAITSLSSTAAMERRGTFLEGPHEAARTVEVEAERHRHIGRTTACRTATALSTSSPLTNTRRCTSSDAFVG